MSGWLPAGLARALDGASDRERVLVKTAVVVVALAVLHLVAWQPLMRDTERTREAVARDRATLSALQRLAQPGNATTAAGPTAPSGDARSSVLAALDAHRLRAAQLDLREGRVVLVLEAVPFDALVRLVDELARRAGLRVVEARLLARVDPGTVRAEMTLGR